MESIKYNTNTIFCLYDQVGAVEGIAAIHHLRLTVETAPDMIW